MPSTIPKLLSSREALDAAVERFTAANPRSLELHKLAATSMPGGNTRTQLHTSPFPICMKSGKGYQVTSEDNKTYTDLVGELTAAVFGHSHPAIEESIISTVRNVGMNLGAIVAQEHIHAAAVCERFDLERVRFTNCGTEANMHALAGARAFTGKRKVVVFAGGYHGGVYIFAGGAPARNNIDRDDFIIAQYNDLQSAQEAICSEDVAAVLVEGMQGGTGAVLGSRQFLKGIEAAAKQAGVIFILDEVMTSRLAYGGLASIHDLKPDLKTLGKYLGGGLAFGAFGGREDVMAMFDPRPSKTNPSPLTHHGTFNNNTLAMHAGYIGLTEIYTRANCEVLNAQGTALLTSLGKVTAGTKMCFTGIGAVFASHFTDSGLQILERETPEDWTLKELFWYEMLEEGFWTTRRGSIALMMGTPQSELDRFVECVELFLERHWQLVSL